MNQSQFKIDDIAREQVLASIISKRDSLIITLSDQLGAYQVENERLKKEIEKLQNKKSKK